MDLVRQIEESWIQTRKKELPEIHPGDWITVYWKIKEGERERIQPFTGLVIQIRNQGIRTTITVRKVTEGVGVERIFPLYSPLLDRIEVLRQGKPRRARLFYVREKVFTQVKIRERKPKNQNQNNNNQPTPTSDS